MEIISKKEKFLANKRDQKRPSTRVSISHRTFTTSNSSEIPVKKPPPYHYCIHCKAIQKYRTKHCKLCEACIGKFDHHCFWIGGCVGYVF